jgi:hypothetical protein
VKIAHITIYPPKRCKHSSTGGVASYTKMLVGEMRSISNDEIYVLSEKIDGVVEEYEEEGIQIIRCFDKKLRFAFQIFRAIKKINPDVIHVQQELFLFGNIITAYLLQGLIFALKKYNTVITLHGVISLKKLDKKFAQKNESSLTPAILRFVFKTIFKPLCIYPNVA